MLPALNEAAAMPGLVAGLRRVLCDLSRPSRIIVVDDGSSDGTEAAARAAAGAGAPLDVVRHPTNRGLNRALDSGFQRALADAGPGDVVITLDADDTHPPELIPVLLAAIDGGSDIAIASRFRRGSVWHGKSWDRVLFSYGVSWLFRLVVPMRGVRDYTCGYRAYRAELLRRAYDRWGDAFLAEASFACMPDILLKLQRLSPKVAEAPLELRYDKKQGPSKMNVALNVRRTLVLLWKHRLGWTR